MGGEGGLNLLAVNTRKKNKNKNFITGEVLYIYIPMYLQKLYINLPFRFWDIEKQYKLKKKRKIFRNFYTKEKDKTHWQSPHWKWQLIFIVSNTSMSRDSKNKTKNIFFLFFTC